MIAPSALSRQTEINAAIQEMVKSLSPDVVRIRYEIGQDWSGEWAIFFRIVLSDDAARRRLREVASKVERGLADRLDFLAMGVYSYHNYRSMSEQIARKEEAWA